MKWHKKGFTIVYTIVAVVTWHMVKFCFILFLYFWRDNRMGWGDNRLVGNMGWNLLSDGLNKISLSLCSRNRLRWRWHWVQFAAVGFGRAISDFISERAWTGKRSTERWVGLIWFLVLHNFDCLVKKNFVLCLSLFMICCSIFSPPTAENNFFASEKSMKIVWVSPGTSTVPSLKPSITFRRLLWLRTLRNSPTFS